MAIEQDPSKKHLNRHGLAIAVESAVAATVVGVAAAEGVRRLRGAAAIQEARRTSMRADIGSLLDERVLAYKNGAVVTTVAALLGHDGPMNYESLKEVAGLTEHHITVSLGILTDKGLAHRERDEALGHYSTVRLDPAVFAAIHENQDAYGHFIVRATELYPDFDPNTLAPSPEATGSL